MPKAMPRPPSRRKLPRSATWAGSDGKPVQVTHCGQLLAVKILTPSHGPPTLAKRGEVSDFSRSSRLRLLKKIATLDWSRASPSLFATLTYPNREKLLTSNDLSKHLHLFRRDLEKQTSKKICMLWRIEWEERKTGKHTGFLYPHFHLMLFRTKFIPWQTVRDSWKKAIGEKGYVRTDVEKCTSLKKCGYYVAKYVAKESVSLVNAAYLDNIHMGRQWGILRSEMFPACEVKSTRIELGEIHDLIRALAEQVRPQVKEMPDSFTLLGPSAYIVSNIVWPKKG